MSSRNRPVEVRPTPKRPTDNMPAQARTRLQARGIPVQVVTGTRREVADKVKAWCKALPRAR